MLVINIKTRQEQVIFQFKLGPGLNMSDYDYKIWRYIISVIMLLTKLIIVSIHLELTIKGNFHNW